MTPDPVAWGELDMLDRRFWRGAAEAWFVLAWLDVRTSLRLEDMA